VTRAVTPRSLDEALGLLRDEPGLVLLAGCTDLMVCGPEERRAHAGVMNLLEIPEIHGIRRARGAVEIGATTSFTEILRSDLIRAKFPALVEAGSVIGGWQIQNRATLGGNMANASPAGDSLPVLLALDSMVVVAGPSGSREIPYDSFHVGYRETALRPGEIIARVRIPNPPRGSLQMFRKVGTRRAQAISKIVIAMTAARRKGRLTKVRIAAGSVAPVPLRLRSAEEMCEGEAPSEALAERAAKAAAAEVHPIDDVRSTAEYRRVVLARIVRRFILQSMDPSDRGRST
jgi:CO/xanthine dehydrogenase FAD-binding subunit